MATILRQQTPEPHSVQGDSIASMNRRYNYRTDSLWTPVARYFAALPTEYSEGEAFDRYIRARHAQVDMLSALAPVVRGLLSAEQLRKLPASVLNSLDSRWLVSIRNGTGMYGSGTGGGGRQSFDF